VDFAVIFMVSELEQERTLCASEVFECIPAPGQLQLLQPSRLTGGSFRHSIGGEERNQSTSCKSDAA